MKLNEIITRCLRYPFVWVAAVLSAAWVSCDSVIYDDEGDCSYYVHFKYDYNMKWADAFSHEVTRVTLYAFDLDGHLVWSKSESGDVLASEGYAMRVDLSPGQYDFVAWCGDGDNASFLIPETEIRTELTATLQREHDSIGAAHVRDEVDRLYYGHLDSLTLGHTEYHFTMPLVKNTNDIRIVLQHLSGEPVPVDMFTYSIVDNNGSLDWNNDVLADETLNYHAWHISSGVADLSPEIDGTRAVCEQNTFSTAVAEFTVSRLMKSHAPDTRLVIRRADTGESVVNINLIDALLLVKGYYKREMLDQEYLDRQDDYSLTFFLDETSHWTTTHVFINSWYVVIQNTGL